MRNLDKIESGRGRLAISCQFNSGRKATVRLHINNTKLIHLSIDTDDLRPYQLVLDGYLHLCDSAGVAQWEYRKEEAEMERRAIAEINAAYFTNQLVWLTDGHIDLDHRRLIVKPLDKVPLGATWQKYSEDNWLEKLNADPSSQVVALC